MEGFGEKDWGESKSDTGWKGLAGQKDWQLKPVKESESDARKQKWRKMKKFGRTDRLFSKWVKESESDTRWKGLVVGLIDFQLGGVEESETRK